MWKERIQALGVECTFRPSALASELEETEVALGVALPTDLKELLSKSNGVLDGYQYGVDILPQRKSSARIGFTVPIRTLSFSTCRSTVCCSFGEEGQWRSVCLRHN